MNQDQKLDRILEEIGEVRLWQATHTAKHEAIDSDVGDLKNTMYGNGTPGVKSRLQTNESKLAMIEQRYAPPCWWQRLWLGVAEKVTSAALIGLIIWVLFLYQNH